MAAEFKVKKKKLGSYPFFSVVFSISLALFVIGLFGVLIIYSSELARVGTGKCQNPGVSKKST